jgi:hypothetical protein
MRRPKRAEQQTAEEGDGGGDGGELGVKEEAVEFSDTSVASTCSEYIIRKQSYYLILN